MADSEEVDATSRVGVGTGSENVGGAAIDGKVAAGAEDEEAADDGRASARMNTEMYSGGMWKGG